MKKGFISMTVVYSFLLIFIFTLLTLLVLYTQKSRLVDSIVLDLKEDIYAIANNSYLFTDSNEQQEFVASLTGYYKVETYNVNGGYASGYIYLEEGEKLYVDVSNNNSTPTSIKCYGDGNGSCTTKGSQDEDNSRIMYVNPSSTIDTWVVATIQTSFVSGMPGMDAPSDTTSSATSTYDTLHPTGKYFLNPKIKYTSGNTGKAKISYIGSTITKVTNKLNNVRYVKDCTNYNSYNNYHQWRDIQVIKDGVNIAKGKTITSNGSPTAANRAFEFTVDGQFTNSYSQSSTSGEVCVTIDLGNTYDVDEINVWHVISGRVFYGNKTSVSSDGSTYTEVINEATSETFLGKRVSAYEDIINGYVQDGLLVWYDGYANNGSKNERNTSTTTWKNLANTSYNGTIANGTWGDNYLSFNGSSSWVNIAKMDLTNFTMDTVFKQNTTLTSWQDVIANWDAGGFGIGTKNNYFSACVHYNGDYRCNTDTLALGTNNMYSYTTVFNQSLIKLYRGGGFIKDYTVGGPMTVAANNTVIALGTNPTGSTAQNEYLNGNIYSARIYNRALTADEIYHNYLVDKERFGLD